MELVCPNCNAKYRISTIALGEEGRKVRCARCQTDWFQKPMFEKESMEDSEYEDSDTAQSWENTTQPNEQPDEVDYEKIQAIIAATAEPDKEKNIDRVTYADKAYTAGQTSESKARKSLTESAPDSILPKQSSFSLPSFFHVSARKKRPVSFQAKLTGYMGAVTVLGAVALIFVMLQEVVVKKWPPSVAIYQLIGMEVPLKGEGLVLEGLTATIVKQEGEPEKLVVTGRILNIGEDAISIPALKAQLRSTNGEDGDDWTIYPELKELPKGESLSFKSDYEAPPQGVGSVNVSFIAEIQPKKADH